MPKDKLPNSYKNLIIYQKAKNLTVDIVKNISRQKYSPDYKFIVLQLYRAVSSVGANIAEGYGKHYSKSFRQFLAIARGSCSETDYWLEIIVDLRIFHNDIMIDFQKRNLEMLKMLTVFMKRLEVKTQT